MPTPVVRTASLPFPQKAVLAWLSHPEAANRLLPAFEKLREIACQGQPPWAGDIQYARGNVRLDVHGRTVEADCAYELQWHGGGGIFVHTRRVTPDGPGAAVISDEIRLARQPRGLGAARLQRWLAWQHRRLNADLVRLAPFRDAPPMRFVLSGSTGLVGSELASFLRIGGQRVDGLVRRQPAAGSTDIRWDPAEKRLDADKLAGADVVVHLAGASIAGGRWTKRRKQLIRDSRVESTRLLVERMSQADPRPKTLICASAVGYYGDRGEEALTEESAPGAGFLADVALEWEAAAARAADAGIRTVQLRIGVVLARRGGALAAMLPAFQLGLGGPLGSGRQFMSWISLDDLVGVIHFLARRHDLSGPFNATAPQPVSNRDFAKTLGGVLGRPAVLPAPAFAVRAALGEMGQRLLLEGCRAEPQRLTDAGYDFLYPELAPALRAELGLREPGDA